MTNPWEKDLLSLDDVYACIERVATAAEPRAVPLAQAHGLRLAEEVRSPVDEPPFNRSAMDGFAVGESAQAGNSLRIAGTVNAGTREIPADPGREGCIRIQTGGAVPAWAVRVVPKELASYPDADHVMLASLPEPKFIRRRGEERKVGDILLSAGISLGSTECAILAGAGVVRPVVRPAPRVWHVTSGDEIVAPEETPGPGQIRDTNATLIACLVREAGAALAGHVRAPDSPAAIGAALQRGLDAGCDLLLLSGGAGPGGKDFGAEAFLSIGFTTHFTRIDLRPGKPLVFATRGDVSAFVLPGNPVSHFATWHAVVTAVLRRRCAQAVPPDWVTAILDTDVLGERSPRLTLAPATLSVDPTGQLVATPIWWASSGDLGAVAGVNALLRIHPGESPPVAGDAVKLLVLAPPRLHPPDSDSV